MADTPPRPTAAQLRYAELFNQSATLKHFGVIVSFPSADRVRAVLKPIRPEQLGGLGSNAVNGGVLAAMFDLAIGCTPALVDPSQRSATVQLSMSFERAVVGGSLYAEAKVDRAGKNLLFASAVIVDEQGRECAHAQGVVSLSGKPWSSGESPAIN